MAVDRFTVVMAVTVTTRARKMLRSQGRRMCGMLKTLDTPGALVMCRTSQVLRPGAPLPLYGWSLKLGAALLCYSGGD